MHEPQGWTFEVSSPIPPEAINDLRAAAWPEVGGQDWTAVLARRAGAEWLHVDFEPQLRPFYEPCGFRATDAGLLDLAAE